MYRQLRASAFGLVAVVAATVVANAAPVVEAKIAAGASSQTATTTPDGSATLVASAGLLASSQYSSIVVSFDSVTGPGGIEIDLAALLKGKARNTPLTIELTETDVPIGAVAIFSSGDTWISHDRSTLNYQTFYDPTDTPFGTTNPLFSNTAVGAPPFPDVISVGPDFSTGSAATMISITEIFNFTPKPTSNASFSGSLSVVDAPEPASLLLIGAGLVILGVVEWRKH